MSDINSMREVKVEKVVINIGSGSDSRNQENARKILEKITGEKPADSLSKKRNPTFKITKGSKIGAFITLRGKKADAILPKLFDAVSNKITKKSVTMNTINFGIKEYIDINGIKYDPAIGMLGMNVNVTLYRRGFRVERKKIRRGSIKKDHKLISKEDALSFLDSKYNVKIGE